MAGSMNPSLTDPYSQASLTFLDTEDHFGADTQPTDFEYADFTLPSQVSLLRAYVRNLSYVSSLLLRVGESPCVCVDFSCVL